MPEFVTMMLYKINLEGVNMEKPEAFNPTVEHVNEKEIESAARPTGRELGAAAAVAAEVFDEGDGGGLNPDCHTNNPDYQDSFTA